MIYRERGISMNIGKTKDNFNKDRKPKWFNYNVYGHIVKDCKKPKKEWDTRKYYKYKKIGHITKDYRSRQKMKNQSVQEDTDIENNDQEQGFRDSPE